MDNNANFSFLGDFHYVEFKRKKKACFSLFLVWDIENIIGPSKTSFKSTVLIHDNLLSAHIANLISHLFLVRKRN